MKLLSRKAVSGYLLRKESKQQPVPKTKRAASWKIKKIEIKKNNKK